MPVGGDARSDISYERDLGVPKRGTGGARPLSAAAGGDRMNRTGGFGTVSEEKYLKLEVEYNAIKRELVARDEKQKQLLVRLAHAEEAAQRAVRGAGGTFTHDARKASEEIYSLRESVRDLTRKLQQQKEKTAHFSQLAKDYKLKYEETMRLTRTIKKPSAESAELSRQLAEANRMITALQQQNMELRRGDAGQLLEASRAEAARARALADKLEREVAVLRQNVLAASAHGLLRPPHALPPSELPDRKMRAGTKPEEDRSSDWVLEEFQLEGVDLLLDRATMKVYTAPKAAGEYPLPVGKVVGGELIRPAETLDLFQALDIFLKTYQARLRDVFDHFDSDGNGTLDGNELGRFLRRLMPEVGGEDVRYFMTMLDLDGDGNLTYEELMEGIRACMTTGADKSQAAEIRNVLVTLKDYMKENQLTVAEAFRKFDKHQRGNLDLRDLSLMFAELLPGISNTYRRKLLAHLRSLDTDGDGYVSLWELKMALQMLRVVRVKPKAAVNVAVAASAAGSTWVLEEFRFEGGEYLLDRATSRVFEVPRGNNWPKPLGRIAGGRLRRPEPSASFLERLDTYLRTQRQRLDTVFAKFDRDHSGALDTHEIGQMMRELMPTVSGADVRFFMRMLDCGTGVELTLEQLVAAIKECIRAASEQAEPALEQVLQRLRRVGAQAVSSAFHEIDKDRTGFIDHGELARMLRRLIPTADSFEQRVLMQAFRDADMEGSGSVTLAGFLQFCAMVKLKVVPPKPAAGDSTEWVLEPLRVDGRDFVVDRSTCLIYHPPREQKQPMRPIARYNAGVVERPVEQSDFFMALDNYLRAHNARLPEVFAALDEDRSGRLDPAEQEQMVYALLPDSKASDVAYLRVMLTAGRKGGAQSLTYQEFIQAITECLAADKAAKSANDQEMTTLIYQLQEYVGQAPTKMKAAFQAKDKEDGKATGYLSHAEIGEMLIDLIQGIEARQTRFILAWLRSLDVNGNGSMSYYEIRQALGLVPWKIGQPVGGGAGGAQQRAELTVPDEWPLEELRMDGRELLLDRNTMRVYPMAAAGSLMLPVGRLLGGVLEKPQHGTDFFAALDNYLKGQNVKLKDVFDYIDRDRSDSLDRREVATLMRELVPEVRTADILFFSGLLDIDGTDRLTYAQLLDGIRECLGVQRACEDPEQRELAQVLSLVRDFCGQNRAAVVKEWRRADVTGRGFLQLHDVVRVLRGLSAMNTREARFLLTYLRHVDVNGTGVMSVGDLYLALGLVRLKVSKPKAQQAEPTEQEVAAAAAAAAAAMEEEWLLEEYKLEGKDYLLDRRTNRLYSVPKTAQEYPILVGKLSNNGLERPHAKEDLFVTIDTHLRRSPPKTLKAAFEAADAAKVGHVNVPQMLHVLRALHSQARGPDAPYFVAMVDPLGKGDLTFQELAMSMKSCVEAGTLAWQRGNAQVNAVITKVKSHLVDRHATVLSLFREFDRQGRGYLELGDLLRLFRRAAAELTPQELRLLLAYMHSLNLEGDGRYSFFDLDQALRTASYRRTMSGTYMSLRMSGVNGLMTMSTARPAAAAPTELIRTARLFGGGPPTVLGGPPPTYHALPLIESGSTGGAGESYVVNPPGVTSGGGYSGGYGSGAGVSPDIQAQLAEIPHLRAQLDEARRQAAALREALEHDRVGGGSSVYDSGMGGGQPSWDEQNYRTRLLDSDLANENALVAKLQQELKGAWERVAMLQKRFDDANATLNTIKQNHSRVLQQLEDTSRQLNQERKTAIRAMNEERRLAMELEAAKELEPLLDQARQDKLKLEKENTDLLQKALAGPGAGNADIRKMRTAMGELQREKDQAERSLAELRRDLEAVGGGKPGSMEDYRFLLADRNGLKAEVTKLEVELQAANEKLRVLSSMRGGGAPIGVGGARATAARNANTAADDAKDEATVRKELAEMREQNFTLQEEVAKLETLLKMTEDQVSDLKAAMEDSNIRNERDRAEFKRKLQDHEKNIDRRQARIVKLEEDIQKMVQAGAKPPVDSGDAKAGPGAQGWQDDNDGLLEGEHIFEVRLHGLSLERAVGENPDTFVTMDFFEHETQATPLAKGLTPALDLKYEFVVRMDTFFLQYMDLDDMRLELNKAVGLDFVTVGLALFPLRRVLEDVESGAALKGVPPTHFVDFYGAGGEVVGTARLSAFFRRSIMDQLRQYRKLGPAPRKGLGGGPWGAGLADTDPANAAAAAAAAAPMTAPAVRVTVERLFDLVPRHGRRGEMLPYVSYQFPGHHVHDTPTGTGPDVVLNDTKLFPLARTAALERRLDAATLTLSVFDDLDTDPSEAGLIGMAAVELRPLAGGHPVDGVYTIFNRRKEAVGKVVLRMAWQNPLETPRPQRAAFDPARPGTAGDAAGGGLSDIRARLQGAGAQGARYTGGDSLDEAHFGRAAQPAAGLPRGTRDPQTFITIGVGKLTLGPAYAADGSIRNLLVMFDIGAEFPEADQRTQVEPKFGTEVDFRFQRSFGAARENLGAQTALARMLRTVQVLQFVVVSEAEGRTPLVLGEAGVNLRDVRDLGDNVDKQLPVIDPKKNVRVGTLTVTVIAQGVLRQLPV